MKQSKKNDHILCSVCGHENLAMSFQCHFCGSIIQDNRSRLKRLFDTIRVFKRLKELELQNKKHAAVIMKICISTKVGPSNEQILRKGGSKKMDGGQTK